MAASGPAAAACASAATCAGTLVEMFLGASEEALALAGTIPAEQGVAFVQEVQEMRNNALDVAAGIAAGAVTALDASASLRRALQIATRAQLWLVRLLRS